MNSLHIYLETQQFRLIVANNKTNINNTTTNTINNSNKKNFAKNFVSHFVSPPLARLRPLAPARDSTPNKRGVGARPLTRGSA